jgi:hypothetical protein
VLSRGKSGQGVFYRNTAFAGESLYGESPSPGGKFSPYKKGPENRAFDRHGRN